MQKHWRGFLGRRLFREMVKEKVIETKVNYYNNMATKVQNTWRGFFIRKYIFNYYSRKRYLEALQKKNEVIRQEMQRYADSRREEMEREREEREKQRQTNRAYREHHFLSTAHIPGIYHPGNNEQRRQRGGEGDEGMESRLRALPLGSYKPPPPTTSNPAWLDYNKYCPPTTTLPPVPSCKPQGPFPSPKAAQRMRYAPLQPSLRVASDFFSLEKARQDLRAQEWVHRSHDDVLQPFTQYRQPQPPLLHTGAPYSRQGYGTRHFREEQPAKHVSTTPFRSQVPPIPVFDKLQDPAFQRQ